MSKETEQTVMIDTVMDLTRTMDAASGSGEWDVVTDTEQQRRPLIKACFGDLSRLIDGPQGSLKLQQLIQDILTTDKRIMDRAEHARTAVSGHLQAISKGQQVSKAYIQNQVP